MEFCLTKIINLGNVNAMLNYFIIFFFKKEYFRSSNYKIFLVV